MNFGTITTRPCVNVVNPPDPRCSDSSFARLHPEICGVQTQLVIKPSTALACALGSVQFKAFISRNGQEEDVSAQTTWACSDLNVAMIGRNSGNATGLSAGDVTITATYQDKTATANLSVLGASGQDCCAQQNVAVIVVLDTSKSMSLAFGAGYATRLDFAKYAAQQFITSINAVKDEVGLITFNDAETDTLSAPTADTASVSALVAGVTQTQQKTSFFGALQQAVTAANATGGDRKVILLISDGEDTGPEYTDATNPIHVLDDFKTLGGIVMCLGVRASGDGFSLLDAFASGGFFINAYPPSQNDALTFIKGLKGYLCAGNCTPDGDVMQPIGSFDYAGFSNWTVTDGHVDLIGNGLVDITPGHGLYVNMAGSTEPHMGKMTSKNTYHLQAGHTYRLSLTMYVNQFVNGDLWCCRAKVFTGAETIFEQLIHVLAFGINYQDFSYSFTAQADCDVTISLQQELCPGGVDISLQPEWGILLDRVLFTDTTDMVTLLDDNFDSENVQYVPPGCGQGTYYHYLPAYGEWGYDVGYNCYGQDCLSDPPPPQLPDPNPLQDIELGAVAPRLYTSTKTGCATCPDGFANYALANIIPAMTGPETSGYTVMQLQPTLDPTLGFEPWRAFDGHGDWIVNQSPGQILVRTPVPVTGKRIRITPGPLSYGQAYHLYIYRYPQVFGDPSIVSQYIAFPVDGAAIIVPFLNQNECSGFYIEFIPTFGNSNVDIRQMEILNDAIPGPVQACAEGTGQSEVSQADADAKAVAAGALAAQAQLNCVAAYSATETYTAKCPVGAFGADVTVIKTASSLVSQQDAEQQALAAAQTAAEAALDCTRSNNTQKIVINDSGTPPTKATPYPTVQHFSGFTGNITGMTVFIHGFTHTSPSDVALVLKGPDDTTCLLMLRCGGVPGSNPVSGLELQIDELGAAMSDSGALASGHYRPTQYGPQFDFPSPLPAGPYGTTLVVFDGKTPNGSWSLWAVDIASGDSGQITGGFEIVFTTDADTVLYAVGDLHLQDPQQALAESISALLPVTPTAFLMLGDVNNPNYGTDAWTRYWNWGFGSRAGKTIYTPGNHDWLVQSQDAMDKTRSFWAGTLAAVYGGSFPASRLVSDPSMFNYAVKFGTWKVICFNSESYENDAAALNVGGSTYNFVATELSEAGYQCILMCHRPRWSSDTTHGDAADLDPIWKLAVQHKALAWFSGHAHVDVIMAPRDSVGSVNWLGGCAQIIVGTGNTNLYGFNGAYGAGLVQYQQNAVNAIAVIRLNASGMTLSYEDTGGLELTGSTRRFAVLV